MFSAILKHAQLEYPNECCGLVVSTDDGGEYLPCHNVSEEPLVSFMISPTDYARAEDNGVITHVVHSHPDTSPSPGIWDLEQIGLSGVPWLIVSPKTGEFTETWPS